MAVLAVAMLVSVFGLYLALMAKTLDETLDGITNDER
jgi:hypothetical protein